MDKLEFPQLLGALVIVGGSISLVSRYNPSAAWLLVGIILLSVATLTEGAPERFAIALSAARKIVLGK